MSQGGADVRAHAAQQRLEASLLLEDGSLEKATQALLSAVSHEPYHPDLPALATAWADKAGDEAARLLAHDEEGLPFDIAVLEAFAWRRGGELSRAIGLLLGVMAAVDDADFTAPVLEWATPAALEKAELRWIEAQIPRAGSERFERLRDEVARRLHEVQPLASRLAMFRARNARERGDLDEALRIATEQHAREPDYNACVALGTNRKEKGDAAGAIAAFQQALECQPGDLPTRLELGDLYLETFQWERASAWYGEVLEQVAPDHEWARPSWLFAQLRLTDDVKWERELRDFVATSPDRRRRGYELLLQASCFRYALPWRREACLQVMRHSDPPVEQAISSMEAPSAMACVWEVPSFERMSYSVPEPDPRQPVREVPFRLWEFPEGAAPRPLLPPPPEAVSSAVRALAAKDYELEPWSEEAARVAAELGQGAADALVATMLHPGEALASYESAAWRFRVQVAAALVLGRLGADEHLDALLDNQVDWTVTAAIVAKLEWALREPAARERVIQRLSALLDRPVNPITWMCVMEPAVHCLLQIPGLPDALRQRCRDERDQ